MDRFCPSTALVHFPFWSPHFLCGKRRFWYLSLVCWVLRHWSLWRGSVWKSCSTSVIGITAIRNLIIKGISACRLHWHGERFRWPWSMVFTSRLKGSWHPFLSHGSISWQRFWLLWLPPILQSASRQLWSYAIFWTIWSVSKTKWNACRSALRS